MGITDAKITLREYNEWIVFDCFNNIFTFDCGIPALDLPPVPINGTLHPNRRASYTSDPLPATIYVAPKTCLGNLTSSCDSPTNYLPSSGIPATDQNMMRGGISCEKKKEATALGVITE